MSAPCQRWRWRASRTGRSGSAAPPTAGRCPGSGSPAASGRSQSRTCTPALLSIVCLVCQCAEACAQQAPTVSMCVAPQKQDCSWHWRLEELAQLSRHAMVGLAAHTVETRRAWSPGTLTATSGTSPAAPAGAAASSATARCRSTWRPRCASHLPGTRSVRTQSGGIRDQAFERKHHPSEMQLRV